MQKIHRDQARKFALDWRDEPLLRVQQGEVIEVETFDASVGYFKTAADKAVPALRPGFDRDPPLVNPIAGPIFVEGAERGDALVVSIDEILVREYSWIAIGPKRGPLGESTRWPELSADYTTRVFSHHPGPSGTMRDGSLQFNDRISWALQPFIGTIGTAPDRETTTSADGQGPWGGNIDVRDIAPGNQIILPVYHQGGLIYLGDVHASQGDTEFTGTAAETQATTRLSLDIRKGKAPRWLRIEKPESIIALSAYRPLETAVENATIHLMEWLIADFGFSPTDAYCLISCCPDFRVNVYQSCRIGKLNCVAGVELPRRYLQ